MTDQPIYQKPSWRRWRRRPTLSRRLGLLVGGTIVLAIVGAILGNGLVRPTPASPPDEAVVDSGGDRPSLLSALRALTGRSESAAAEPGADPSGTPTPESAESAAGPPPAIVTPEGLAVERPRRHWVRQHRRRRSQPPKRLPRPSPHQRRP